MSDESLFREVDEEVRQDQFKKLWDRYGNVIVALCLVVVAAVAGFKGWQYWQVKQAEVAGESFFTASKLEEAGKADEAMKQFESIGHSGYGVLARLRAASANGKPDEAVKAYDAIAADTAVAPLLRDLARIRAAYLLVDRAKPEVVTARVKDIDAAGNSWRHAAREIMALALWRANDYAGTDKQTAAILADPETPPALRKRAQMLSELLLPKLGQK